VGVRIHAVFISGLAKITLGMEFSLLPGGVRDYNRIEK
jgi:hypothetical protein